MIRLVDVDVDNWLSDLRVSTKQMDYVLDPYGILARAYAYRGEGSRAFFIYNGDTPVGMGLYCDYPELLAYELNQFFIDEQYQRRGYGKAALKLILDEMRRLGRYHNVVLWCIEGDKPAIKLFKKAGFSEISSMGNAISMAMEL